MKDPELLRFVIGAQAVIRALSAFRRRNEPVRQYKTGRRSRRPAEIDRRLQRLRRIEAREWIALAREHLPRPIRPLEVNERWRALPYEIRHARPEKGPRA